MHHSDRARMPAEGAKKDWRDSKSYWRVSQGTRIVSGLNVGVLGRDAPLLAIQMADLSDQ